MTDIQTASLSASSFSYSAGYPPVAALPDPLQAIATAYGEGPFTADTSFAETDGEHNARLEAMFRSARVGRYGYPVLDGLPKGGFSFVSHRRAGKRWSGAQRTTDYEGRDAVEAIHIRLARQYDCDHKSGIFTALDATAYSAFIEWDAAKAGAA